MTRKLSNGTHIKRDLYKSEKRPIRRCIIGKGTFSFLPVALCDDSKLSKELSDCTKVDSEVERLLRCWAVFNFCSTKTQEMTRFPITNLFFLMPSALTQKQSNRWTSCYGSLHWAISQKLTENKHFFRSWAEVEQRHIWQDNSPMWKGTLQMHKALCKCTCSNLLLEKMSFWQNWRRAHLILERVSFLVNTRGVFSCVFFIGNKECLLNWEQNISNWEQNISNLEQNISNWEQNISNWEQNISNLEQNISNWEQNISNWEQNISNWEQNISIQNKRWLFNWKKACLELENSVFCIGKSVKCLVK